MTETADQPIDATDQTHVEPEQEGGETTGHGENPGGESNHFRDQIVRLEQQNRQLAEQHDLLKRVMLKNQEATKPESSQDDESDGDYLTKREAREWYASQKREDDRVRNIKMDEVLLNQETGDYYKVVKSYAQKAMQEDPDLQDEVALMAQMGKNAASYLYKRCKQSRAYLDATKADRQSKAAQSVARNSERAPSLSQMGKAGTSGNAADYYKNMPSKDFNNLVNRLCNGA